MYTVSIMCDLKVRGIEKAKVLQTEKDDLALYKM